MSGAAPALDALAVAAVAVYALATFVLTGLGLHAGALAVVRLLRPPRPLPHAPDGPWPLVVVQVPVYDEPPALVARALDAALALEARGPVEVQLLDDSPRAGRLANAALCAERRGRAARRGATLRHLSRDARDGFKAGALAAGLHAAPPEASARGAGRLAAVFDVDFRPAPDALLRLVPALLADPDLAFVQAGWAHPEADDTALGRVQAAVLDLHFAVEQAGRDRAGLPVTFNGTAGVWRVAAIESAGGWQGDTLAEDLDLALRAQAAGWRARLVETVRVSADLPPTVAAWRRQQARWAKGLAEVGRKSAGAVWRSGLSVAARAEATAMPALSLSLPSLLVVAVLHPVVALAGAAGVGPASVYVALGAGWAGLAGLLLAHVVAQRALYPDAWVGRLRRLPLVLVAPLALVVPAARAVLEAARGRRTPFERTLKTSRPAPLPAWEGGAEAALAVYSVLGFVALLAVGAWAGAAFQGLLAAGFAGATLALRGAGRAAEAPAIDDVRRVAA
ncbi:glycosyltransferase family 2 protein [Rubrivirga sp. S365]|uniref:glycosyltransferase family 2 protein n=1 Tax=Rubrivirga sp. S365 TaxID=3076080 RepID=UPI0028CAED92|nr:glycosyltransferase family 2 protein [Rubrivirga sp. S365]MDT7855456.1 glycosyltransferase family 2 protein [Rubrivirga sp. S365]